MTEDRDEPASCVLRGWNRNCLNVKSRRARDPEDDIQVSLSTISRRTLRAFRIMLHRATSGVAQKGLAVTFMVHASRGEDVTTTIRLSVVVAIAKGRTLANEVGRSSSRAPMAFAIIPPSSTGCFRSARDREFAVFPAQRRLPGGGVAATGQRRPTRVRRPDVLALL
jgi:hypothetical protein